MSTDGPVATLRDVICELTGRILPAGDTSAPFDRAAEALNAIEDDQNFLEWLEMAHPVEMRQWQGAYRATKEQEARLAAYNARIALIREAVERRASK